jgi:sigma-B regulation protein RsbU (phosphoserine phosphatase)
LLPQDLPQIHGFEVATFYQTSARAGGDYYDFFPLGDRAWGVFIADVSGHGTPAAVLMAVTHAIAHTRPGPPKPPSQVLSHLDRHLAGSYTTSGAFVTAFYAALDPDTRRLTYSTAGHNPPRLLRAGRILSLDKGGGLPLGISGTETYTDTGLSLEPGDLLVLYTDGITEAAATTNGPGPRELFGVERLDQLLISAGSTSAQACIERICAEVASFTGNAPPTDDQTLVVLRRVA